MKIFLLSLLYVYFFRAGTTSSRRICLSNFCGIFQLAATGWKAASEKKFLEKLIAVIIIVSYGESCWSPATYDSWLKAESWSLNLKKIIQ